MSTMDPLAYLWNLWLLSIMAGCVMCETSDFTLYSISSCKTIYVDKNGTNIKWEGARLSNCIISIRKENVFDDEVCVEMIAINIKHSDNEVKFKSSSLTSIKTWNWYSFASSIPTCTIKSFPYITINTVSSFEESFELKVYSRKSVVSKDRDEYAQKTDLTFFEILGIGIGAFIGLFFCCACCKGIIDQCSHGQHAHVHRQPAATAMDVENQQPIVQQGQPRRSGPQQQLTAGYQAQQPQTAGYPTQLMAGYNAPQQPHIWDQCQGFGYGYRPVQSTVQSAPPLESQSYMEEPPPYSVSSAPLLESQNYMEEPPPPYSVK